MSVPPLNPATEDLPNIDHIVIEDGVPVDGITTEKQMRLLTEPLYTSWPGPGEGRPFSVMANVGLFYAAKEPPLVPDVMLSLDVRWPADLSLKENNTYFVWLVGKVPDTVIEIVSNREGGEDTSKLRDYARLGIPYYVIYDPQNYLGGGVFRLFERQGRKYRRLQDGWIEEIGLGLRLWEGTFEEMHGTWLRWFDRAGNPIPTGAELAEQQSARAEQEQRRAEEERQRAEQEQRRAEEQRQRAEQEQRRAEEERQRALRAEHAVERLRAKLRELGIEPPTD